MPWRWECPLASSLEAVLFKELFIFACFIVPVAALASATRNMMELIAFGAVSGIGILVEPQPQCFFPRRRLVSNLPHGDGVAPAPGAARRHRGGCSRHSLSWIIIGVDSRRRARLAVIGAVCLVFVQLPWSVAFAVEKWVSGLRTGRPPFRSSSPRELPRANRDECRGRRFGCGTNDAIAAARSCGSSVRIFAPPRVVREKRR